jgi:hypothetical protein
MVIMGIHALVVEEKRVTRQHKNEKMIDYGEVGNKVCLAV